MQFSAVNTFLLHTRFRLLMASTTALTCSMMLPSAPLWMKGCCLALLVLAGLNTLRHKSGMQQLMLWIGGLNLLLMSLGGLDLIPHQLGRSGLIILYVALCSALFHRLTRERPVSAELLYGLCALYLQIALAFALAYEVLEFFAPGAFVGNTGVPPLELDDFTYYSLITLTTLGYGDIYPIHPVGRLLATVEAVAGVLFIALAVSRCLALLSESSNDDLD